MGTQVFQNPGIVGKFYKKLEASPINNTVGLLALRNESDNAYEQYAAMGQVPALSEYTTRISSEYLSSNNFLIRNRKFGAAVKIPQELLDRDQSGQVDVRIGELAGQVAKHDMRLLSDLILNGAATTISEDGQYFFDTDHQTGKNTANQSNKLTFDISDNGTGGTATAPTATTMQVAIMNAISSMMGILDNQNEPYNMGASKFVVMAPPSLMGPAMAAVYNPTLDSGRTNTIVNSAGTFGIDLVVNPYLTSWTDKFVTFRADADIKPFIIQDEVRIKLDEEFEAADDEWTYFAKKRGGAGYFAWQLANLTTLQA